jgi:alkylation response protein AidB-like acyl-CoA dehydrogenase
MSFEIPPDLHEYLSTLDTFITTSITPLQTSNDNNRFFDHRREHARTNWEEGGLPREDWESLLDKAVALADEAGFYRFALPAKYGGSEVKEKNYWMAVIREHLASKGLGLFNDLQTEHSVVGNFPDVVMAENFGTLAQKNLIINGRLNRTTRITFGLTEPEHGSSVLDLKTRAVPDLRLDGSVHGWRITGGKKWQSGMNRATHCLIFARTAGKDGDARGISCFIVDPKSEGFRIESYQWYEVARLPSTVTLTSDIGH